MARKLIIDDDDQFLRILRITLEKAGYQVDTARDGADGLKPVAELSLDLVITDIVIPEKEGIETITELRREFPGLKIFVLPYRAADVWGLKFI